MPKVGEFVTYVTSKGQEVPALVITTPESFVEGSSLEPLQEGELNLTIFRINGPSVRKNVPSFDLKAQQISDDEENLETEITAAWKPVAA